MFRGTIPQDMRAIIQEIVRSWDCSDVYVGCSGNFTVERVLQELGRFTIHGNDVTVYSTLLGGYLAGKPDAITVREEWKEEIGWLEEYLKTPAATIATVLLCTRMFEGLGKGHNPYYARMQAAWQTQWPTLHEKTLKKVEGSTLKLASFFPGDVCDWVPTIPQEAGVICFPPFFAGDYENMFKKLEQAFTWTAPTYTEMDAERRQGLLDSIRSKRYWILGTHVRQEGPEWEAQLRGMVQTTNRGVPIYVYASSGTSRIVKPRQELALVKNPRLGPEQAIGDRMGIAEVKMAEFASLRSQYMNKHIRPGMPSASYAVLVDGYIVGCFAVSVAPTMANWDIYLPGPHAYLLSDFPVDGTQYPRLAKLVLYAALSQEAKLLFERVARKRIRGICTTAFSQNPVSMKYRGLFDLMKRKEAQDGLHKFQLEYGSAAGRWSLQDGLKEWKAKHGKPEK